MMRNWLSSVTGMNSVPIAGINSSDPPKMATTEMMRLLRWPMTQASIS